MTESDWIKAIAADPPGTLYAAMDWFIEQGDEAAASFCRWLWERSKSGKCTDNWHHDNKEDYVGPFYFPLHKWWQWYVPQVETYNPANGLPVEVAGELGPCGMSGIVQESWAWAFNAWRLAYYAGKLDDVLGVVKDERA